MAIASELKARQQMVAIIGDGSITGGMAYEAMNTPAVLTPICW